MQVYCVAVPQFPGYTNVFTGRTLWVCIRVKVSGQWKQNRGSKLNMPETKPRVYAKPIHQRYANCIRFSSIRLALSLILDFQLNFVCPIYNLCWAWFWHCTYGSLDIGHLWMPVNLSGMRFNVIQRSNCFWGISWRITHFASTARFDYDN